MSTTRASFWGDPSADKDPSSVNVSNRNSSIDENVPLPSVDDGASVDVMFSSPRDVGSSDAVSFPSEDGASLPSSPDVSGTLVGTNEDGNEEKGDSSITPGSSVGTLGEAELGSEVGDCSEFGEIVGSELMDLSAVGGGVDDADGESVGGSAWGFLVGASVTLFEWTNTLFSSGDE